jgi:hypothetical protein
MKRLIVGILTATALATGMVLPGADVTAQVVQPPVACEAVCGMALGACMQAAETAEDRQQCRVLAEGCFRRCDTR